MKSVFPSMSRTVVASLITVSSFFAGAVHQAQAERLSTSVTPRHYTLTLTPDLKAATFSGVETIEVTLTEATKSITLNSPAF
jgi:aminopeptidase N